MSAALHHSAGAAAAPADRPARGRRRPHPGRRGGALGVRPDPRGVRGRRPCSSPAAASSSCARADSGEHAYSSRYSWPEATVLGPPLDDMLLSGANPANVARAISYATGRTSSLTATSRSFGKPVMS